MEINKLKRKSTKELDLMLNNEKLDYLHNDILLLLVERKSKFVLDKEIEFNAFRSTNKIKGIIKSIKKSYNDSNFYCVIEQENGTTNSKKLDFCYNLLLNQ